MKLHAKIREALEETGLPWDIELGSRHLKIKVSGRLAGILPKGKLQTNHSRSLLNTVSQIRNVAREIKETR